MATYVYQLVAKYVDPFCPGPAHAEARPENMQTSHSTTVFTTPEKALSRADTLRALVRGRLKLADDYPIIVDLKAYEVVD